MKIWGDFKISITACLLPIAILLNYIVDNIVIKKILILLYTSLLLLESLYRASKNRPLNRKDKAMLMVICFISIFMFIYLIFM